MKCCDAADGCRVSRIAVWRSWIMRGGLNSTLSIFEGMKEATRKHGRQAPRYLSWNDRPATRGPSCRRYFPGLQIDCSRRSAVFQRCVAGSTSIVTGAIVPVEPRAISSILRVMGRSEDAQLHWFHRVLNRAKWSSLMASRQLLHILTSDIMHIPENRGHDQNPA
jgi:hypothetical protein